MKYQRNSFIILPNKNLLKGKSPYLQSIYLWICEHSDENGVCFPSRITIAKEAGVDIKTVDRIIPELENMGILEKITRKEGAKNLSNIYQIMIVEDGGVAPDRRQGSPHQSPGVAPGAVHELNPVLTQPNEEEPGGSLLLEDLERIPCDDEGYISPPKKKKTLPPGPPTPSLAEKSANIRQRKIHPPFDFMVEFEKLRDSKWKRDKIVALVWKRKGYKFDNWTQFNGQLSRDRKEAAILEGYSGPQIDETILICEKQSLELGYTWGITTIVKKIAGTVNR